MPFSAPPIAGFVRDYYRADPETFGGARYELALCGRCTLVFQAQIGGPDLLRDLYTDWIDNPEDPEAEFDSYRSDINAIPQSRDAHEIMTAAALLGRKLSQLRTLDYGMGWGLWARIAGALGCESYGTDLSERRMDFARRHGVRTVTNDELSAHRFDFINTEQVFEHVPEPLELLGKLAAALAPGGVVKISVPSGERVDAIVGALGRGGYRGDYASIVPVQPLEHVNSFTKMAIATMAARVGLREVRPSYAARYRFLRHPGTLPLSRPKKAAKEMVRPFWQWRDPNNLYVWLRAAT